MIDSHSDEDGVIAIPSALVEEVLAEAERLTAIDTMLAGLQRWSGLTVILSGTSEFLDRLPTGMACRADLRIAVIDKQPW